MENLYLSISPYHVRENNSVVPHHSRRGTRQPVYRYTMSRYLDITLARLRGPAGGAVRGAGGCGGQPAGRLAGQETAAKQGQNPRPLLRHPGSGTS